jgi:hypothetical protein
MENQKNKEEKYLSLSEAATNSSYSQEYLSLRARQGKLKAVKLAGTWFTTSEWLSEYTSGGESVTKPVSSGVFRPAFSWARFALLWLVLSGLVAFNRETIFLGYQELRSATAVATNEFLERNGSPIRVSEPGVFVEGRVLGARETRGGEFGGAIGTKLADSFDEISGFSRSVVGYFDIDIAEKKELRKRIGSVEEQITEITEAPTPAPAPALVPTPQEGGDGHFTNIIVDRNATVGGTTTTRRLTVSDLLYSKGPVVFDRTLTVGDETELRSDLRVLGNTFLWETVITGPFTVYSNIIPGISATYDLGSPLNRFRNLYLSGNIDAPGSSATFNNGTFNNLTVLDDTLLGTGSGDDLTVAATATFNAPVTVNDTATFNSSVALTTMTPGSVLFAGPGGVVSEDNANFFWDDTANRIGIGTNSPTATLHVVGTVTQSGGQVTFNSNVDATSGLDVTGASLTVGGANYSVTTGGDTTTAGGYTQSGTDANLLTGSTTVSGQLIATRAPTIAHTFGTWAPNVADSAVSDATIYVNPASAVADSNLLGLAVGGNVKFLVDAEGDVFVNSLTAAGSVTQGSTTVSSLTVEGNTTLGDASTDLLTVNATSTFNAGVTLSTFTQGSVLFAGPGGLISQDNTNFFWDDSTNRLGLGDSTPAATLTIGAGDLFQVNSSGAIAAVTGITSSGAYTQSGTSANTFTGAASFTAAGTALSVTNDSSIGGTLTLSTLGAAGSTAVCRNGSSIIATCSGSGGSDPSVTLQNAYNNGNTIATTAARNIALTFAADTSLTLDAATTDTTQTTGVIDLDVDSATTGASAADINFETTGTTLSATQNAINIALVQSNATNARTLRGINLSATDAGTLANTLVGLNVDVTTANANDTTYAAVFQGGNVGVGTATPSQSLSVYAASALGGFTGVNLTNSEGNATSYTGLLLGVAASESAAHKGGIFFQRTGPSGVGDILFAQNNVADSTNATSANAVMVIKNSGNVGIGDTSPAALLTVGSGDLFQVNSSGDITTASGENLGITAGGTGDIVVTTDADTTLQIAGLSGAAGTSLCIDGTNNVVTCSTGSSAATLQSAYDNGNTITTTSARNIALTFAANTSLTLDAATTDTTQTSGVIDLDVDSSTNGASAADINFEMRGAPTTQNAVNVFLDPNNTTAATLRGINISANAGGAVSLANTIIGLNIDVTTSTSADTTYAAILQGGNVGVGTATPQDTLDINGIIRTATLGSAGSTALCRNASNQIAACSGSGGSSPTTLQQAYNNSTSPEIVLDATRGALTVRDAASPIGANLLEVQNNAGSTTFLAVTTAGASITGNLTVNQTSAANVVTFQDSGTTVFSIADEGAALFKPKTDSTTAFQVQPSGSTTPVLDVDTTNSRVGVGTNAPAEKLSLVGGVFQITESGTPETLGSSGSIAARAVFVVGRYAYVGNPVVAGTCSTADATGCEFRIYDVSNPASPVFINGVDITVGVNNVKVVGKYAYLANDNLVGTGCSSSDSSGCEFRIYDISNPSSITFLNGANMNVAGKAVYVAGRYAYVVNSSPSGGTGCSSSDSSQCELWVFDISNPASPTFIGGANTGTNPMADIMVVGKYAYLAGNNNSQIFRIYDISNPQSPSLVVSYTATNGSGQSIYVSGKYAFVGNSLSTSGTGCSSSDESNCEVRIYDISNPASPTFVGGADFGAAAREQAIQVVGRYLHVGFGSASGNDYKIYDISTPSAPTEVGGIDPGAVTALNVTGKYAYLGAAGITLRILDLSGADTPTATVGTIATNDLLVTENARFTNTVHIGDGLNVGVGGIYSNGPISVLSSGTGTLPALDVKNSAGTQLLFVRDDGLVGVGTASPGAKLDILNTGTAPYTTTGLQLQTTFSPSAGGTQSNAKIVTTNAATSVANTTRGLDISIVDATALANTNIGLYVDATTANGSDTQYSGIFLNGNLGIGDSSPAALLTVGSGDLFQVISTGEVRTIAGAVGAPSYSFTGDPNTGIYGVAQDILRFATGGSDRVTINASGNVGIGTTSPDVDATGNRTLTVYTTSGESADLEVASARADASGVNIGKLVGIYDTNSVGHKLITEIRFASDGTTANQRGGKIELYTKPDASTTSTRRMTISNGGNFTFGEGVTSGTTTLDLGGTGTANAVCHTTQTGTNDEGLVDCTSSPIADYAEMYPVTGDVEVGDLLVTSAEQVNTYNQSNGQVDWGEVKGTVSRLTKSASAYQSSVIGIVSDNYSDFSSTGYNIKEEDNPKSVALAGRVLVKASAENGAIAPGDVLTSASIPGHAMKATAPGRAIGIALSGLSGGTGQVMVFVNPHWYSPEVAAQTNTENPQTSGDGSFTTLTTGTLTVTGTATFKGKATFEDAADFLGSIVAEKDAEVKGNVTVGGDLIVKGAVTFEKNLTVKGDLIVEGNATFKGKIAGSDSSRGKVTIAAGENQAVVTFATTYASAPVVSATPRASLGGSSFWVDGESQTGFTVHLSAPTETPVEFTWIAIE